MKRIIIIIQLLAFIIAVIIIPAGAFSQSFQEMLSRQVKLPNGWALTPAGTTLPLGDLPLNMAVSPGGSFLAVTCNGQSDQGIHLIDVKNQLTLDTFVMGKSWLGLKFSSDERYLYASGGNDNFIIKFEIRKKHLYVADTFFLGKPWPKKISPAGIEIDDERQLMYVVTKENNTLYVIDLKTKEILHKVQMDGEGYTCLLDHKEKFLYVSCWGCGKVLLFNTRKFEFTGSISVGSNPNDMCMTHMGKYLYVANANDNSVSVIDIKKKAVIQTLNAALYPNSPSGSTTNSVALSRDENNLYVANADNNCLAVFDVSNKENSTGKGFIPVGWYPTSVRVLGKTIFVTNGKGTSSYANPRGPSPGRKKEKVTYQKADNQKADKVQYIGGLFRGKLSVIPEPGTEQAKTYSQLVYANSPYKATQLSVADSKPGSVIPAIVGSPSPIRHVFYIVKENRTYDQVLGDMPGGNGDTSLVLFGEKITPNQHALAREFVLLDNFYVDAEVSADGHNWSMGAYATDYLEKTWPTSYGGRGGSYDSEGVRGIANSKDGFIWDLCKRHDVTYRTYGEFADDFKPNIPALKGHLCPYYTSWDQKVRDTVRFHQWKRDFDSLLAIGQVPQLNTLRFINDHTEGTSKGRPTPFAHVADNDLAVGMFVEYLSKSPIWKESVVFILEDDAQNGPDHVDAHRSPAYLAGGFVKRGLIDHTLYSTSSMLRTMELILGLPPMSQYDAAATPMWRCFADSANTRPFRSRPSMVDLDEKNIALNQWSEKSEGFDFSAEDRVPEKAFNEVLWYAVKGNARSCPAPVHAAFVKVKDEDED